MSFTRVVGAGIHTLSNITSHNIHSSGIITAVGLDVNGNGDISGNLSVGGVLTYEDVTSIDSVGIITARSGIQGIGIQSGGVNVAVGVITALNFIGVGNTFKVNNNTVDISIQGGGGGSGAGFSTSNAGLHTTSSIGVNTSSLASTLTGIGNSFQGIYVSNGMMIMDNTLNGNHYIGTTYNGLMAGPVRIEGTLSIDGNYVVV